MNLFQRQIFGNKIGLPSQPIALIDISDSACYVNGATTMTDLVTGKVFSLTNGPVYSSLGLLFDGTNDYAIATTYPHHDVKNETTIEFFFKLPTVGGGYRELFSFQANDTGGSGYHIQRNGTALQFTVGGQDYSLSITLVANTKYFISITISNTTMKIYLNGVYQRTITIVNQYVTTCDRMLFANTQNARWCNILLYYLRINNTVLLTDSEILSNYTSISAKF